MKHASALLIAGLLTAGSAVAQVDLSRLPPPSKEQGVTFDKDIKPLFEASCVRCHSGDRARNNLHLDSLEGVLKGSKDHKVIDPGDSGKSPLVIAVAQLNPRSAMPPPPRPAPARRSCRLDQFPSAGSNVRRWRGEPTSSRPSKTHGAAAKAFDGGASRPGSRLD
jgi:Planctomycete cytochrome C